MRPSSRLNAVEPLIARVLGIEVGRVTDDLSYQSISRWDSFGHVQLMLALETEFDTRIDSNQFVQLQSVKAIKAFVESASCSNSNGETVPAPSGKPAQITVYRGLEGVYFDRSAITFIDGEKGVLELRGFDIHDLAEQSTFEETTWLLLNGELPCAADLNEFTQKLRNHRELPPVAIDLVRTLASAHPVEVLRTAVSVLGALENDGQFESSEAAIDAGLRLISQIPTLIAAHHAFRNGHEPIAPDASLSHAENFLYMLFGEQVSGDRVSVLNKDLIIHADHGANASTFVARICTGCKANLYASITAAIAAFSGALHGGAAEQVIKLIDTVGAPENAAEYVRNQLDNNKPVMGFGHRVYKVEDPRSRHLRAAAATLSERNPESRGFEILEAVVEAMEPYARHGVGPNVDLYSGLTYRLLGLPDDLAVPIFIAGRVVGWVAQALEQRSNNVLIRPLLQYVGSESRSYVPIHERPA